MVQCFGDPIYTVLTIINGTLSDHALRFNNEARVT